MVKLSVSELSDIVIGTPSIYTIFIERFVYHNLQTIRETSYECNIETAH